MDSSVKKRKYVRRLCPHCNREVSKSTWYVHYQKFYDPASGEWNKDDTSTSQRPDFNFEEHSSGETETEYDGDFSFPDDQEAISNVSI